MNQHRICNTLHIIILFIVNSFGQIDLSQRVQITKILCNDLTIHDKIKSIREREKNLRNAPFNPDSRKERKKNRTIHDHWQKENSGKSGKYFDRIGVSRDGLIETGANDVEPPSLGTLGAKWRLEGC